MKRPIPIVSGFLGKTVHHLNGVQGKKKLEIIQGSLEICFYRDRRTSSVGHGCRKIVTTESCVGESKGPAAQVIIPTQRGPRPYPGSGSLWLLVSRQNWRAGLPVKAKFKRQEVPAWIPSVWS